MIGGKIVLEDSIGAINFMFVAEVLCSAAMGGGDGCSACTACWGGVGFGVQTALDAHGFAEVVDSCKGGDRVCARSVDKLDVSVGDAR